MMTTFVIAEICIFLAQVHYVSNIQLLLLSYRLHLHLWMLLVYNRL